jgi:hypothetical protein
MYIVSRSAFVAKCVDCRLRYLRVIGCLHVRNHACKLCLVKSCAIIYDILCHDSIENNGALMRDYVWHVIMLKTGLLCSCRSLTWLVMVQCCLGLSIIWSELMVKNGRGQTRVVLCFRTLLAFSSNQTEADCIVAAFSLRKPVVDRGQIYKRNETNLCVTISVTTNTACLHISHHNFLKHAHAYYSFAD